jgi:hypothetical protein
MDHKFLAYLFVPEMGFRGHLSRLASTFPSLGSEDQQVAAPSAVMREWPQIPEELEKKYAQREVVVAAVVDRDGKVSHLSVKETPDARVSNPIMQVLSKCVFSSRTGKQSAGGRKNLDRHSSLVINYEGLNSSALDSPIG